MELEIKNVTKQFDDMVAVDHINLQMKKGVYGLLGVNGAGKTTLMRMICTLLSQTEGEILCNGTDIRQLGENYRNLIGYLPQDFGFYPEFTVKDYLGYIAALKGLKPGIAKKRCKLLLEQVGMDKAANKKMKKLSGGMKRRVGIAQALLNNPELLVLDEPTAGLDPNERISFRNLISKLSEDKLVLLSTHIVSDVEYIANEILLMRGGKIEHTGTAEELLDIVKDKVWICHTERKQASVLMQKYRVANVKTEASGVELRIVDEEKPTEDAMMAEGMLEDVFLYYFGEKGGVRVDTI